MKVILTAIQFLTIIPLRKETELHGSELAKTISVFPIAGLIQGMLFVGTAYLSDKVFPMDLTPLIVLLLYSIINGGFHIDGLSDTFDALSKRGTTGEKISVMKDSRAGAVGVTAVVFSILIKYLALRDIHNLPEQIFYFSILLMPCLSKWAMVMAMWQGRPAKEDGLGKTFIDSAKPKSVVIATVTLFLILGSIAISQRLFNIFSLLVFLTVIYVFTLLSIYFFRRQFGGLTGDTLGAISELTEIVFLMVVITWF